MILLDTHVFLWLVTNDPKLGKETSQLINEAVVQSKLIISAISFWEIAMLALKNRITLPIATEEMRRETLQNGLQEIPLKGDIGILAAHLIDFHADPADRFIVATAIYLNATLLTVDQKILDWSGKLSRFPANK